MHTKHNHGKAARSLMVAAAAAPLAGIVVSGCGDGSGGTASSHRGRTTPTRTPPASAALTKASGGGSCQQWPGVGNLTSIAVPLRELAGAASIAAALRYHARRPTRPLRTILTC